MLINKNKYAQLVAKNRGKLKRENTWISACRRPLKKYVLLRSVYTRFSASRFLSWHMTFSSQPCWERIGDLSTRLSHEIVHPGVCDLPSLVLRTYCYIFERIISRNSTLERKSHTPVETIVYNKCVNQPQHTPKWHSQWAKFYALTP